MRNGNGPMGKDREMLFKVYVTDACADLDLDGVTELATQGTARMVLVPESQVSTQWQVWADERKQYQALTVLQLGNQTAQNALARILKGSCSRFAA